MASYGLKANVPMLYMLLYDMCNVYDVMYDQIYRQKDNESSVLAARVEYYTKLHRWE